MKDLSSLLVTVAELLRRYLSLPLYILLLITTPNTAPTNTLIAHVHVRP